MSSSSTKVKFSPRKPTSTQRLSASQRTTASANTSASHFRSPTPVIAGRETSAYDFSTFGAAAPIPGAASSVNHKGGSSRSSGGGEIAAQHHHHASTARGAGGAGGALPPITDQHDATAVASSSSSSARVTHSNLTRIINNRWRDHYRQFEQKYNDKLERQFKEALEEKERQELEFIRETEGGTAAADALLRKNQQGSAGFGGKKKKARMVDGIPSYARARDTTRRRRGVKNPGAMDGDDENNTKEDSLQGTVASLNLTAPNLSDTGYASTQASPRAGKISPTPVSPGAAAAGGAPGSPTTNASSGGGGRSFSNRRGMMMDDEYDELAGSTSRKKQNNKQKTPHVPTLIERNISLVTSWKPEPIPRLYGKNRDPKEIAFRHRRPKSAGSLSSFSADENDDNVNIKIESGDNAHHTHDSSFFLTSTNFSPSSSSSARARPPSSSYYSQRRGTSPPSAGGAGVGGAGPQAEEKEQSCVRHHPRAPSPALPSVRLLGGGVPPPQSEIEARHEHCAEVYENRNHLAIMRRLMILNSNHERSRILAESAHHLVIVPEERNRATGYIFPPSDRELRHRKRATDKLRVEAFTKAVVSLSCLTAWVDACRDKFPQRHLRQPFHLRQQQQRREQQQQQQQQLQQQQQQQENLQLQYEQYQREEGGGYNSDDDRDGVGAGGGEDDDDDNAAVVGGRFQSNDFSESSTNSAGAAAPARDATRGDYSNQLDGAAEGSSNSSQQQQPRQQPNHDVMNDCK